MTNWNGNKVLVTGAAGFIGSHLTEKLVNLGAEVKAFTRYTSRFDAGLLKMLPAETFRELDIIFGDLRDSDAVRQAVRGCETVLHLGANISIPYSYVHPREVIETNVLGTLNVIEAVRRENVKIMVHTSTSEVFGTAQYVPIDEKHVLQAQSPYSASKIGADKIVESYRCSFNVRTVTLRPFNTYGPRQSARAIIPTIITQALMGNKIQLGSLHPTRDFTFVSDTVDAFLTVAKSDRAVGEEINLGTGQEISIGDLLKKIGEIIGRPLDAITDDKRIRPPLSEVERLLADNAKSNRLTGWLPKVSLDDGLSQTVAWIKEHLDLYQPGVYQI